MTLEEFKNRYHITFTEQQLQAVQSVEGPTLLLAVPGSGKTTVLVARLGYMIYCCGIAPENILTVTYTVAATKDMSRRFAEVFGEELSQRLEFRTINGICAKIIQYYGKRVGKKAFDLVTDEGFKAKMFSQIYQQVKREYPTESDLQTIGTLITYIKNMQLSKEEILQLEDENDLPVFRIYEAYCREMRNQSLMDYDDQMVYAYTMLRTNPEVRGHFQDMYRYICVDEAQDTSKIQHAIIALLAQRDKNLFMVGDEDQSIYGFRAAYPEALLDFEKVYPSAKVLLMEDNFRSNAKIVRAADGFIQKNELRHEKHMKPTRPAATDIRAISMKSRKSQYSYLAKVAEQCETETAVLYRDNESILPVVDLLERKGIPYRIRSADLSFFSHKIVVDIQNIIRFAANPKDTDLFLQIYYKIGTFLNKQAALEACRISEERNIEVMEAALRFCSIPAGTQRSCKSMQTHLEGLLSENADRAMYRIINFMGYAAYLERMHYDDRKLDILRAIAANETSASSFVERLQELSVIIREKEPDWNCKFILSTIHSSKGLEYDTVYLMDAMDGIFPETVIRNRRQAEQEEIAQYEEERRLYYVGVTRAKNKLNIFTFSGKNTFTDELVGKKNSSEASMRPAKTTARVSLKDTSTSYAKTSKKKVTQSQYEEFLQALSATDTVKHKKYGIGSIEELDGDQITIQFEQKKGTFSVRFLLEQGLLRVYP